MTTAAKTVRKPSPTRRKSPTVESSTDPVTELKTIGDTEILSQLNRVRTGHESIAVTRKGQPVAVLIPIDEYQRLRQLEDLADGLEAQRALEDFEKSGEKAIPSSEVLRMLKRK